MRDPNRINRIVNLLRAYWLSNPDLRLGQIVVNATPDRYKGDPFHVEDDILEAQLRDQLDLLTQIAVEVKSNEVEKI